MVGRDIRVEGNLSVSEVRESLVARPWYIVFMGFELSSQLLVISAVHNDHIV
jgi:hypothetical protein